MTIRFTGADKSIAPIDTLAICEAAKEALRLAHNNRGAATRAKVEQILGVKWENDETFNALLLRRRPDALKALAATTEYQVFRKWQRMYFRERMSAIAKVRSPLLTSIGITSGPPGSVGQMLPQVSVTTEMVAAVNLDLNFEVI